MRQNRILKFKNREERERERELHCGDKIENQKLILRSPER